MITRRNSFLHSERAMALLTAVFVMVLLLGLMVSGLVSLNSTRNTAVMQDQLSQIRDYRVVYAKMFSRQLTKVFDEVMVSKGGFFEEEDLFDAVSRTESALEDIYPGMVTGVYTQFAKDVTSRDLNIDLAAQAQFSQIHDLTGNPVESVDIFSQAPQEFIAYDAIDIMGGNTHGLHELNLGHPCVGLEGRRVGVVLHLSSTLPDREWDSSVYHISYFQIPMSQFSRSTDGDLNLSASTASKSYIYTDSNLFAGGALKGDSGSLMAAGVLGNFGSGKALANEIPDEILDAYREISSGKVSRNNNLSGSDLSNILGGTKGALAAKNPESGIDILTKRRVMRSDPNDSGIGSLRVKGGSVLRRREFLFGARGSNVSFSDWTPPPYNWMSKTDEGVVGIDQGAPPPGWFRWNYLDEMFADVSGMENASLDASLSGNQPGLQKKPLAYRDFKFTKNMGAQSKYLFNFVAGSGVSPSGNATMDVYIFERQGSSFAPFGDVITLEEGEISDDFPIFSFRRIAKDTEGNNTGEVVLMIDVDLDQPLPASFEPSLGEELSWYLRAELNNGGSPVFIGDDRNYYYRLFFRLTGDAFGDASFEHNDLSNADGITLSFSNAVVLNDFNNTAASMHDGITLSIPKFLMAVSSSELEFQLFMSLNRTSGATTSFAGSVYGNELIPRSYFPIDNSREFDGFIVNYRGSNHSSSVTGWRRFSLVDYASIYTDSL